jgi:hypothetical protein
MRGFRTRKNEFRIGGNTFYDRKNKILMKIPESKRSEIGMIAEFCGILDRFPILGLKHDLCLVVVAHANFGGVTTAIHLIAYHGMATL